MTTRRGRPRDPSRDRLILRAARQVLAERGFTGATMEQIASTAGVGKDTLYRRWSSKEALAIDVIEQIAAEAVRPVPLDPDPRFNLFMYLKDIVRLNRNTDFGPLVAGVVGEAARNEELAEAYRRFWNRRRQLLVDLVVDVVGDGHDVDRHVDRRDVDRHVDQILGPLYYRQLLTGGELGDDYLWDLVAALPWTTGPQHPAQTNHQPKTGESQP